MVRKNSGSPCAFRPIALDRGLSHWEWRCSHLREVPVLRCGSLSTMASHASQPHAGSTARTAFGDEPAYPRQLYLKCDSALNEAGNSSVRMHTPVCPSRALEANRKTAAVCLEETPRLLRSVAATSQSEGQVHKQTRAPARTTWRRHEARADTGGGLSRNLSMARASRRAVASGSAGRNGLRGRVGPLTEDLWRSPVVKAHGRGSERQRLGRRRVRLLREGPDGATRLPWPGATAAHSRGNHPSNRTRSAIPQSSAPHVRMRARSYPSPQKINRASLCWTYRNVAQSEHRALPAHESAD